MFSTMSAHFYKSFYLIIILPQYIFHCPWGDMSARQNGNTFEDSGGGFSLLSWPWLHPWQVILEQRAALPAHKLRLH